MANENNRWADRPCSLNFSTTGDDSMIMRTKLRTLAGALAFVVLSPTAAGAAAGFGDVASGIYYEVPVAWLVDNQITTGVEPGCFAPDDAVTRGQLAAFLFRLDSALGGSPSGTGHPFVDVLADYQQEPVAWMFASGITTGTSTTTYSPDRPVTRGEFAVMLWRYSGRPSPAGGHGFLDITRSWQDTAVAWMSELGVTTGTTATTFSPEQSVTRGQAATFMWRYARSPSAAGLAALGDPGRDCTRELRTALVAAGLSGTEAACSVSFLAGFTVEELTAVLIGSTSPSPALINAVSGASEACLTPDRIQELIRLLF